MRTNRLPFVAAALLLFVVCSGCARLKSFGYSGFGRDGWQKPDEVVDLLDVRAGDRIADLGAGGGYFTFRLSEATGPRGKVYAVDVDKEMTEYLEEQAKSISPKNVEVILAEYHDPLLPEGGVDLLFTCNTYHHIQKPDGVLRERPEVPQPGRTRGNHRVSSGRLDTEDLPPLHLC